MAYKKTESQEKAGAKLRKPRFDTFPKSESTSEKPKKRLPYGQSGANYFEKRKKKPLGEDELPASRGFAKSKTGYNNPNAPWNREKAPTKKWDADRTPVAKKWDREAAPTRTWEEKKPRSAWSAWEEKKTPDARGPLKTFAKKWALKDPTQEVEHENDPANYGPAKLQFRRISKRAARSFSKNKEAAYAEKKWETAERPAPVRTPIVAKETPRMSTPIIEEKKKFMHGKWKPIKKGESRGPLEDRGEKPKPKKKHNPKPFKAAMPSNWRKVGE